MIGRILLAPFNPVGLVLAGAVRLVSGNTRRTRYAFGGCVLAVLLVLLATTFERFPVVSVQRGFRGVGMIAQYNPRTAEAEAAYQQIIAAYPPVQPAGKTAAVAYKNIQVLKDVDANEMLRLMAAMSNWLAPSIGCSFCHSAVNMADDTLYTKTVTRRMIQMTRYINTNWRAHVGAGGVTCNTCHRGAPQPRSIWYVTPPPSHGVAETQNGENIPSPAAGLTALPYDPFTPFMLNAAPIRVQGTAALPYGNRMSIEQTNWTYAYMIHFAQALGVSCNYCHNTRAFGEWDQSTPQRVTAWYAIQMVRDLNHTVMVPLTNVFPPGRRGALGDVPKINCATCHAGAYKPLYGASTLSAYPELEGSPDTPVQPPTLGQPPTPGRPPATQAAAHIDATAIAATSPSAATVMTGAP